jgi:septum formation protein
MMNDTRANALVLASASPRRKKLLETVGVDVEVHPSGVGEETVPGESPDRHVARLARAKALEVGRTHLARWVLGADTAVVVDREVLGKPRNEAEAYAMLRKLSGREHFVMTGYFIYHSTGGQFRQGVVKTRVTVKSLTDRDIQGYIRTGEPFDKAGAYAVQGIGMFMIEKVTGSYPNVVGLPVCEVIAHLRDLGAIQFLV